MILVLRALARLFTFLLLLALAVAGLAVAVFAIFGSGDWSLPGLANLLGLPDVRDEVGSFLNSIEQPGAVEKLRLLAGLGAMLLGVALLVGALGQRRDRLAVMESDADDTLAARRPPLAQIAGALVDQAGGVTESAVRVRPRRRGQGGRLKVRVSRPRNAPAKDVEHSATEALSPVTEPFSLKPRVQTRLGQGTARVQ